MRVKQSLEYKDELGYILRWIDVFSAVNRTRDEWLPKRKREYYAITIYLYNKGENLGSKGIPDKYKQIGNFNNDNGEVSNYRRDLVKSGWIIPTRNGFKPLDAFIDLDNKIVLNYEQRLNNV